MWDCHEWIPDEITWEANILTEFVPMPTKFFPQVKAHVGPAVITIGGRLGRNLIQLLRLPVHLLNLASFKAQQVMLARTGTKLIAVFVAGIPLCALGGIFYAWTSGKSLLDGFISAYGALYKVPGIWSSSELVWHRLLKWSCGPFQVLFIQGILHLYYVTGGKNFPQNWFALKSLSMNCDCNFGIWKLECLLLILTNIVHCSDL